jgi:uncharacterized membrane protein
LGDISIYRNIFNRNYRIEGTVESWATIYRNYRHARWLSWYCFACAYSFYQNPKKFFQFLENIVFKSIKTISWIKYEFSTIQKLIFVCINLLNNEIPAFACAVCPRHLCQRRHSRHCIDSSGLWTVNIRLEKAFIFIYLFI